MEFRDPVVVLYIEYFAIVNKSSICICYQPLLRIKVIIETSRHAWIKMVFYDLVSKVKYGVTSSMLYWSKQL